MWLVSGLCLVPGRTTQLGPVRVCPAKGPQWEDGEKREREEGHEPMVYPASGPHLELEIYSPRAGRGNV